MAQTSKLKLKEYIASKDKKQTYVNQMFATIAPRYDLVTSLLSYGRDQHWKRQLVKLAEIEAYQQVLDLACGTGDIAFLIAGKLTTGHVVGVDITPGMLEIAEQKRVQSGLRTVSFEWGDISKVSYPDNHFDRVTVGYGVRNIPDISRLLKEVLRLLKPGGRFFSLDFGKPSNRFYRAAYLNYLTLVGSSLGWILHGDPDVYRYIPESLKLYPGQGGLEELMKAAGFVETGYRCFLGGATAINYGTRPPT